MPVIAAYRLMTNFLKGYYRGDESFASKRDFLEFLISQVRTKSLPIGARGSARSTDGLRLRGAS
jgi:hypothetical protein